MNPEPCDVLVLGADERSGLATARSLHWAGLRVLGGGLDLKGFGFRSRSLRARFIYPDPEKNRLGFVQCVRKEALRYRVRAILPALDTTVMALHEERRSFEGVAPLGIAQPVSIENGLDKVRLRDLSSSLGIDMPRTLTVEEDPDRFPPNFPLPAVVKQRESGRLGPRKVIYCSTRTEVLSALRLYLEAGHLPIVQELIFGYGVTLTALCRDGEMIHTFQYRRAREYTCRGGLGTQMVSEPVEAAVRDCSSRLLRALKWQGIVGVEFKLPANRPACPVLLEINPRCPGTIELSRAAGVNFPLLHFKLTVGEQVPTRPIAYRCGVRYHRWLMDSLSLIELLLDRPTVTGVPLPGRARAGLWKSGRVFLSSPEESVGQSGGA